MEIGGPDPGGQAADNGATRQIRGTHSTHEPIVRYSEEPLAMKLSAVAPCPAGAQRLHHSCGVRANIAEACRCLRNHMHCPVGSALIRDNRAWHGKRPILPMRLTVDHPVLC